MSEKGSMERRRRSLLLRAFVKLIGGAIVLGITLFLAAGTVRYWQAWIFLLLLFGSVITVLIILILKDPDLLERRMKAKEKERAQKLVQALVAPVLLAVWLIPGFDVRWGWSSVPVPVVVLADALFLAAYFLFYRVLRSNSYAARTVEVEQGQNLMTTGPYAVIRHPMYAVILLIYLATPVALGSYWGLLGALPLPFLLALRIRNEETVLLRDLTGYEAYMQKTRYRLVPFIW